jgi:peptidoglycan/LPS O-acetylase OafA/YrhL
MIAAPVIASARRPLSYLPTLDGWRAIAVLMVVYAHTIKADLPDRVRRLPLWYGVDIFFGISGLLICSRLLEERARDGRISLRGFYIRRVFRIFPAAWTYLAVLALLTAAGVLYVGPADILGSLLSVWNYYPANQFPPGGSAWFTRHFWSLAVEEHFYLFLPALVLCCSNRRLRWVLPVLAMTVATWRAIDGRLKLSVHYWPGFYELSRTDLRLDALLWGCWAAVLFEQYHERMRHWLNPITRFAVLAATVGSLFVPSSLFWRSLLIPWLLVSTVLSPESWLGRFLESPPMRWLGRISYSLYLWQMLFFVEQAKYQVPALYYVQTFPGNFLATLVCAVASYYLLERPLTRLGHRLTRSAVPVPVDAPTLATATSTNP